MNGGLDNGLIDTLDSALDSALVGGHLQRLVNWTVASWWTYRCTEGGLIGGLSGGLVGALDGPLDNMVKMSVLMLVDWKIDRTSGEVTLREVTFWATMASQRHTSLQFIQKC